MEKLDIVVGQRYKTTNPEFHTFCEYAELDYIVISDINKLLRNGAVKNSSVGRLYSRNIINEVRFATNVHRYEDVAFNIEILCSHEVLVALLNEPLYYVFVNEKSLTHRVKSEGQVAACVYLYSILNSEKKFLYPKLLFMSVVKSFLSVRYLMSIDGATQENIDICKSYIKRLKAEVRTQCHGKNKAVLLLFLKFPFIYRIYREVNDPTLRTFRKQNKKGKKE